MCVCVLVRPPPRPPPSLEYVEWNEATHRTFLKHARVCWCVYARGTNWFLFLDHQSHESLVIYWCQSGNVNGEKKIRDTPVFEALQGKKGGGGKVRGITGESFKLFFLFFRLSLGLVSHPQERTRNPTAKPALSFLRKKTRGGCLCKKRRRGLASWARCSIGQVGRLHPPFFLSFLTHTYSRAHTPWNYISVKFTVKEVIWPRDCVRGFRLSWVTSLNKVSGRRSVCV